MYVGRIMHTNLIVVEPETSLSEASQILAENKIEHLLVIDKQDNLQGILSDRDIKLNQASPATTLSTHELNYLLGQVTVEMIMVKKIITITPDTTVERAAYIMTQNNISSLPVVKNDKAIGIITSTDIMGAFLECLGMDDNTKRLIIFIKDSPGYLAGITDLLKNNSINIMGLVTWPEKKYPGIFQMIIRTSMEDGEKAIPLLQANGYKVIDGYVEDHTPYIPE